MEGLTHILEKHKVDVATFQEVTPLHCEKLLAIAFVRNHFWVSPLDGQDSTYKTLILSKFPPSHLTAVDMPYSPRKILLADILFHASKGYLSRSLSRALSHVLSPPRFSLPCSQPQLLQLVSVHLKSEAMATRQRKEQLEYLYKQLKPSEEVGGCSQLIAGDFNYQFKDEPKVFLEAGFTDVWASLHPRGTTTLFSSFRRLTPFQDKGETFDATKNPHAASTCPSGFKRRLGIGLLPPSTSFRC